MVHQIRNETTLKTEPKKGKTHEAKPLGFLSDVHNRMNHLGHKMATAIEITKQSGLWPEQEINRAAYFLQRTAHAP